MATNLAAIDIGTNSVLLLVAHCEPTSRTLTPLLEMATITRLGQNVDRTRQLAPEAVQRTLACLEHYGELLKAHAVQHLDVVSTSAARDAQGADSFLQAARDILGVRPQIISGQREAELTFAGAVCGLNASGWVTACDVGGGSTEVVFGQQLAGGQSEIRQAVSVDVGSVRLTERHFSSDPPTETQINAARQDVRNELQTIPRPGPGGTLVGLGGTITTLAAVSLGLEPYDAQRVHGATLSCREVQGLLQELGGRPMRERRSTRGLDPRRADIIVAGTVLVDELMRWSGAERMLVSDRGVRWGLAIERCRTL